ncbi:MAG: hypothetical protein AAF333_10540 [Planctomycetota bacterium]
MTPSWALQLPIHAAGQLGRLRCLPGLEVHESVGEVWLRGDDIAVAARADVLGLPATNRYEVNHDLQLVPMGGRLPVGTLPDTPWAVLSRWLEVVSPATLLSGCVTRKVELALARTGAECRPNLLVTGFEPMRAWAEHASDRRLVPLSVANDLERRRVAVQGTPLPPLPGQRYVMENQIGLPAGYGFALPISNQAAVTVLGLDTSENAVFETDGTWSRLPDDAFVAATRGTLRLLSRHTGHDEPGGVQSC